MAGRGKAYREKRRKEVTAPSGEVYTIKKPGARTYTKQFRSSDKVEMPEDIEDMLSDKNLEEMAKEVMSEKTAEELALSMDQLLFDCVVDPKIVEHETDKDDELWIEDVGMADYFFLVKEINEFAGVTPEKLRELFRNLGGASGTDGGPDISGDPPKA